VGILASMSNPRGQLIWDVENDLHGERMPLVDSRVMEDFRKGKSDSAPQCKAAEPFSSAACRTARCLIQQLPTICDHHRRHAIRRHRHVRR
jgi:hypothetical protein